MPGSDLMTINADILIYDALVNMMVIVMVMVNMMVNMMVIVMVGQCTGSCGAAVSRLTAPSTEIH